MIFDIKYIILPIILVIIKSCIIKSILTYIGNIVMYFYISKVFTIIKCTFAYTFNTFWNFYISKTMTRIKGKITYFGYRITINSIRNNYFTRYRIITIGNRNRIFYNFISKIALIMSITSIKAAA